MNDDDFERKLRALTGALERPDPTPAWKADILARARREANAVPASRLLPPRWLMLGWAAAWAAVFVLDFAGRRNAATGLALQAATPAEKPAPPAAQPPEDRLPALVAFHQRLNLNLDLP